MTLRVVVVVVAENESQERAPEEVWPRLVTIQIGATSQAFVKVILHELPAVVPVVKEPTVFPPVIVPVPAQAMVGAVDEA